MMGGGSVPKRFTLSVGSRRQVTFPAELMKLLSLDEGSTVQVDVSGETATLIPCISVPRTQLPAGLRRQFETRRGAKPSDLSLNQVLHDVGYRADAVPAVEAEPVVELSPDITIGQEMLGQTILLHTGSKLLRIPVTQNMVGRRVDHFRKASPTKAPPGARRHR
jgi:ribosomal protein S19